MIRKVLYGFFIAGLNALGQINLKVKRQIKGIKPQGKPWTLI